MQIVVAIALLIAGQGELFQYDLEIDPAYLEELYSNPWSGTSYPAVMTCPQGETPCMVRFRGNTSLELPKKNWFLELDDPYLIGRSRLLLDAHYRDKSLMRNCMGMMVTELLGYPSSQTRHVRFSVNGEYYGVYLETERIDTDFLNRVGLEEGALFKGAEHTARFCWMPSGYWQDLGFEPRLDSDPFLRDVIGLVDRVNSGDSLPELDEDMFLAYYAATLAIMDLDSPSKNFYLYMAASDETWRIFPWDRDASFGNDWLGNYNPEIVTAASYDLLMKTSLFPRLLDTEVNRTFFTSCLDSIAVLMTALLPEKLDSIYDAIKSDVYLDPFLQGAPGEFDQAYTELRQFLLDRPQVIQLLGDLYEPVMVVSLNIEPVYIEPSTDSIRVTLEVGTSLVSSVLQYSIDSGEVRERPMIQVPGSGGRQWIGALPADSILSSLHFTLKMRPAASGPSEIFFYYPLYGYIGYPDGPSAQPGAVRAQGVFSPGTLEVLPPLRYGASLWAIPILNVNQSAQDLSLCSVAIGTPPGRVFFPDSTIVQPGDTLYISCNARNLAVDFPLRDCFGDCVIPTPSGSRFVLFDPSWSIALQTEVPEEDSTGLEPVTPLISEVCYDSPASMDSGDWLELYNSYGVPIDLGGFVLLDGNSNMSLIPWGTSLEPAEAIVIAHDPDRFALVNPGVNVPVVLGFGLPGGGSVLTLLDRTGEPVLVLEYDDDPPWPDASNRILSLLSQNLPIESPSSWEAVDAPGSPGSVNPSWFLYGGASVFISTLWPNPASSVISFEYTCSGAYLNASIFDLTGRIVQTLGPLPPVNSASTLTLSESLASGIYFLVLESAGKISIRRFVCLR